MTMTGGLFIVLVNYYVDYSLKTQKNVDKLLRLRFRGIGDNLTILNE